jgi:hypothetical protein
MKKIIIGLMAMSSISAFANGTKEITLKVNKCIERDLIWREKGYICSDATNQHIGSLVARRLTLAGYVIKSNAEYTLEINTDKGFYPFVGPMQTQNGTVLRLASAILKDSSGIVVKQVSADEVAAPLKSMAPLIDQLIDKL